MTKAQSGVNLKDNAPDGIALTPAEQAAARKDGAKDAVKESGKDAFKALTDGIQLGDPPNTQYLGSDEIMQYEHLLTLGVGDFEKLAADKHSGVPEDKLYGLLALERNGKNRTPYVKALMKRLGLKADELPGGGPSYTNDVTNITEL